MPTLPVNGNGTVLYYEDSGVPNGATDYTTIIIFHGFIFHGGVHHLMLRLLSQYLLSHFSFLPTAIPIRPTT